MTRVPCVPLLLMLFVVLSTLLPGQVRAQEVTIPEIITYQGYLRDTLGNPVTATGLEMIFTIYEDDLGTADLWQEMQYVDVTNGFFTVYLPFPPDIFQDTYYSGRYLGIQIDGEAELTPLQQFSTTPYSFYACEANNALTLGGLYPSDFGDGHSLDAADGAPTNAVYVDNRGFVGMSTLTPLENLEVAGAIKFGMSIYDLPGTIRWTGTDFEGRNTSSWVSLTAGVGGGDFDWTIYGNDMYSGVSGNVGIGTLSPSTKLDVLGTVTATAFVGDGSGLTGISGSSLWSLNGSSLYYNSGYVGVGTDTPLFNFHVEDSSPGSVAVRVQNLDDSGDERYFFGTDAGIIAFRSSSLNPGKMRFFNNRTSGHYDWVSGGQIRMTLDSNGYLGIGTDSPQQHFHLQGDSPGSIAMRLENLDNTGDERFYFGTDIGIIAYRSSSLYPGKVRFFNNRTSGHYDWVTDGQIRMTLDNDGNLGIGTETPSTDLEIGSVGPTTVKASSPSLVGSYDTTGFAEAVYVIGKYAYVADYFSGLQIVDVSDPTTPSLIGTWDTPGSAYGVYVCGDNAYIADGSSLQILDIARPFSPILHGYYNSSSILGIHVSGNYAYLASGSFGLRIIDVSHPFSPTLKGSYDTPGDAQDVFVRYQYAFVADGASGLQIISIVDPASPTLIGSYSTPDSALGVYVGGKYAYVVSGSAGLQIIDISNPSSPTLAGSCDTPGLARKVHLSGRYAYVADGTSGLQIIDISDPSAPALEASYDTSASANGVFVSGKHAYVADLGSGLQIIDLPGIESPTITAGDIGTGNISVTGNADVGNNLNVYNGLTVGFGGINSDGEVAVSARLSVTGILDVDGELDVVGTANIETLSVNGSAIFGTGGTPVVKLLSATATIDFPNTAANFTSDRTFNLTGVEEGDPVFLSIPDSIAAATGGTFTAWISSTDTVKIRYANHLTSARDPLPAEFRVVVMKF